MEQRLKNFKRPSFIAFVVISVLLAVISISIIVTLSYRSIKSLNALNIESVNQYAKLRELDELLTNIRNYHSDIRDYVITKDKAYLENSDRDKQKIREKLDQIIASYKGREIGNQATTFGQLVNRKLEFDEKVMKLYKLGGRDLALDFVETGKARVVTDSLENVALMMKSNISKRQEELAKSYGNASDKTVSFILVAGVLVVLLAAIFMFTTLRNIQKGDVIMKELENARIESEKAAAFKGNFMANMSHEIRTPMNAIVGFANLLSNTKLNRDQADFVNTIKTASEDLLHIINDILDFSKLEAGMMRIEAIEFSPAEVLHSVKKLFEQKVDEKKLDLQINHPKDLPSVVIGDSVRLNQILVNLVGNAIKFTEKGSVKVDVSYSTKGNDIIEFQFKVSDSGIGIPADKIATIFERFEQINNDSTRKHTGTGLGLAIVKTLVELQDGEIFVTSQENKGTVFTFRIPYKLQTAKPQTAKSEKNKPAFMEFLPLKGLVLLAEDNVMNQKLAAFILKKWQIDFDIAPNGAIACDMVKQKNYSLVLMDVQMPEMDGYQATMKIRNELKSNVPIVALTAHAIKSEKEKSELAGMNGYLTKPFKEEDLYEILKKYLSTDQEAGQDIFTRHKMFGGQLSGIIDIEALRMISHGNPEFVREMVEIFGVQIRIELLRLKEAIKVQNPEQTAQIAHSIKSTVGYVGIRDAIINDLNYLESFKEDPSAANFVAAEGSYENISGTCIKAIEELKMLGFDVPES